MATGSESRRPTEIRRALRGELAAIGELTVAAYERFTLGPEDPYVARLRDAASRFSETELWVAVEGDRLLGTVSYCPPESPWRELAGEDEGEFRMLAVDPAEQGRGVGSTLVRLCDERAREHCATSMVLSSLAMMSAAHAVYRRAGYERAPDRDWEPLPGVHLVAFTKTFD